MAVNRKKRLKELELEINILIVEYRKLSKFKTCPKGCFHSQCCICRSIGPSPEDIERMKKRGLTCFTSEEEFQNHFILI